MKVLLLLALFCAMAYSQINMECALLLPAQPTSAAGLAIPYQLLALNAANGPCNQVNVNQAGFVQGVIYDNSVTPPRLMVYNPIVVDMGTKPAVALVAPVLNPAATIGLWFGSNANTQTLMDNPATPGGFAAANCVNGEIIGAVTSLFGQFAYCNALTFFAVTNTDLAAGTFVPPPLGTASDGLPCPTTRDFSMVDQDPSDNVVTAYIVVLATGLIAVNSTANIAKFGLANVNFLVNPSDNRLLGAINGAIGCPGWKVQDLNDPTNVVLSQATNELHAAAFQGKVAGASPPALIPINDPMARNGNQPSLNKVNLYRQGLGQPMAITQKDADVVAFCKNLYMFQPIRLLKNVNAFFAAASPDQNAATSLLGFLANRFVAAFGNGNLGCTSILGVNMPINLTLNGNGVVVGATIVPPVATPATPPVVVKAAASSFGVNALLIFALLAMIKLY